LQDGVTELIRPLLVDGNFDFLKARSAVGGGMKSGNLHGNLHKFR
jgi:hypothetical protein